MIGPKDLADFAFFTGFALNDLSRIATDAELLEFAEGATVFADGVEATRLFGVLDGEVDLILVARDNVLKTDIAYEEYSHSEVETLERQITVDSIGPGEIFGWSALTPGGRYTSKAVCCEPTRVFAIPSDQLRAFFNDRPQVGYPFMERLAAVISNRLANRTDKLIEGWIQAFAVDRI